MSDQNLLEGNLHGPIPWLVALQWRQKEKRHIGQVAMVESVSKQTGYWPIEQLDEKGIASLHFKNVA